MALAILIPIIVASGIALETIWRDGRQATLRGLNEAARVTAQMVDREIQSSISALTALASSPNLEVQDFQAFYHQAKAFNQPSDTWIALFDDKGTLLVNTAVPYSEALQPPHPVIVKEVMKVLASHQPTGTDLIRRPVSGMLLTATGVLARTPAGKSFVVAQVFSVDYWKKKALQADLPDDWLVGVIDRNGYYISGNKNGDEVLGKPAGAELVAAAAASPDGFLRQHMLGGIEAYAAFTHSELTGWTIPAGAPVSAVEAPAYSAFWWAMAGICIAVIASALAIGLFARRFIGAIEGAGRSASSLGRGHQPVVERSSIREVNQMNDELVLAGQLLDAERKSLRAVEYERGRLLISEQHARQAAEAQNDAKDEFLAMLGHELRNPLAAIASATTLLETIGPNAQGAERCIKIINRQNHHLSHIVNDLLDVSRLVAGKIELENGPLDMADCVATCVEALCTTELAKCFKITVDASRACFNGDTVRIEQILVNLLTNALKFSDPGGEVRVLVRADAARVIVSIHDAGAGIAPELLTQIFEPFVQGPAPANRMQYGLGIGLALVMQLVRLHGGDVKAESAGIRQGSTFTFWLPLTDPSQSIDAD